jgi:hypothetical protein
LATLRNVWIDFVEDAPTRWVFEGVVHASRERVFAEVSGDAKGWAAWFPGVRDGGSEGLAPGARRWVRVGRTTFHETIVAFDEPWRWAFRVDETSAPLAEALVEEWTFSERGEHTTRVRWTFAADPRPLMRLAAPVMRPYMQRLFNRAMRNLERRISG